MSQDCSYVAPVLSIFGSKGDKRGYQNKQEIVKQIVYSIFIPFLPHFDRTENDRTSGEKKVGDMKQRHSARFS